MMDGDKVMILAGVKTAHAMMSGQLVAVLTDWLEEGNRRFDAKKLVGECFDV
jgi:hypothetical protein